MKARDMRLGSRVSGLGSQVSTSARLGPGGVPRPRPVNQSDTLRGAVEWFDLLGRPRTDRIGVSSRGIGVVGVEALDSRFCSPNAPDRAMPPVPVGNPSLAFVLIPAHRLVVSRRQARIIGEHLFGRAHTASRLDASDPFRSERAREPVERRKRRSVIEKWRDGDDYRKAKVATASDVDHRSWRSLDLSFDNSAVIHPDRRRSR